MVEDHSAGTEYTAAEYTGVDQPEDKYRGDGEPPLNRYTLGTDEQPGTTSADLRPEPTTDFRSELPPAPTPDQLDFLVPPPAPRRPEPETHLSPSLPIPMPEPLAPRYRPTDTYRSEPDRAVPQESPAPAAPLPTGFPEQPSSTSYFGAAPTVSGSGWRTDQSASWSSDQHHPETEPEPTRDEQPSYSNRPIEPPAEPLVERVIERPVEPAVERPVELPVQQSVERVPERPAERAPEQRIERAPEPAPEPVASGTPGATPNTAPDWGVSGGPASGPRRNEGDARAEADSAIASNPTPAPQVPAPHVAAPQVAAPRVEAPVPVAAAAPVMDLGDAWTRVLAGLPPNQRAWLTNSRPVTLHESTAIVAVPDDFTRGQLETRLRPDLERILSESFGRDIRIAVTVDPSLDPELQPQAPPAPVVREPLRTEGSYQPTIQSALTDPDQGPQHYAQPTQQPRQDQAPSYEQQQPAAQQYAPQQNQPFGQQAAQQPFGHQSGPDSRPPGAPAPAQPATEAQGEARLNPKYTFETFVIGSSNRFAHAAAVAVAEAPGKAYNPQLIYGDSGLGKTHLLHAIGHYVRSLYTGARVRYVSSEEFTNDFINAIRDDKASQFQRRYRDVDVLLIDDIQFLEGKIQTQEEFFHTFNTLHNANKQIVISSDRAPKRLEALEDRLRNRFEWGLITDIQPPDLETRIAILRKKAATERLTAPPEVLEFIASKVQTNIRELEGALIRVTAFASLNRQPVDLSLAEIVLKDLIPEGSKPEVTASMIMGQTASYFGLSIDDLCGSSRSRVLVTARQIAMYLCRELTDLSLPKIGQQFGGRDHTTVMHAERKIRQLMSERRSVFNQVTELTNRIKHQAKQQ